ncbi:MAG TPA: sigma-70 family RNA polymerase sigma factor [Bacteroidales bacterium]|nr:sigma-70 family RNA polymerase sigma factor [Bacteroidales bacterium]HPT52553.1 sigma-70 family RNA polymerase sigma factor [Bacteroidales bacterium]
MYEPTKLKEEEQQQLIAACLSNSRKGQHKLFKLYYGKMTAVCMRYANNYDEAQDMLNEGFMKIFANLDKYADEGSFEAWMKRVMVNAAIDYQRKYKTIVQTVNYEVVPEVEIATFDENKAISKMSADELLALIQKLPPTSRNVFNMYVFENYSHAEISKILDMKQGTSHWHLNFARTKLKELITKMI